MPTSKGSAEVRRFMAQAPQMIAQRILPGAARAAGTVVADEAKSRAVSQEIADNITIRVSSKDAVIAVRISVKEGWARSLGIWAEYGTSAHFISVDADERAGMSVRRINRKAAAGSLVIGGNFIGKSVRHPGARPHPFLRVSLDVKAADAIAAAQNYINTRVARMRSAGLIEPEAVRI